MSHSRVPVILVLEEILAHKVYSEAVEVTILLLYFTLIGW